MEHYFTEKPTSDFNLFTLTFEFFGHTIELYTASGVFAPKKVDRGTQILLKSAKEVVQEKDKILDLGCGYGVLGISLKKLFPKSPLTFSDINERALKLTRKNLERNRMKGSVKKSDAFKKIKEKFNIILLNPPQHAGKELCMNMISEAKQHLEKNGKLLIVARHNKGGKTLSKHMEEIYGNLETLQKSGGFRVYQSTQQAL